GGSSHVGRRQRAPADGLNDEMTDLVIVREQPGSADDGQLERWRKGGLTWHAIQVEAVDQRGWRRHRAELELRGNALIGGDGHDDMSIARAGLIRTRGGIRKIDATTNLRSRQVGVTSKACS